MSKRDILLIGAGGHANACIDLIEQGGQYSIAGLVGTREELHSKRFGYTVIATDEDLPRLAGDYPNAIIAVGQIHSAELRIRLSRYAVELGFTLPSIVAPTAHVSEHASVGTGTVVLHGAVLNAGARVGDNCIINTRAVIEHDAMVEDNCHISTGAILNGGAFVGAESFVGSGSVVRDGIRLGTNCVIGMGLSVRHSLPDHARYTGHDRQ